MVANTSFGVSSMASGRSSLSDIQSMAPAANQRPYGRSISDILTNRNAGTATIGWGREETIDHQKALVGDTPLGTIIEAMARPSGIFCIAITSTINSPKLQLGQKAKPIAIPSTHECTVITAKKRRS